MPVGSEAPVQNGDVDSFCPELVDSAPVLGHFKRTGRDKERRILLVGAGQSFAQKRVSGADSAMFVADNLCGDDHRKFFDSLGTRKREEV